LCAPMCLANMSKLMNHTNGSSSHDNVVDSAFSMLEELSEPKKLDHFCNIYQETHRCLKECPESPFDELLVKGLTVPKFVCVDQYEAFKKNAPCLHNVTSSLEAACNKTCGAQNKAIQNFTAAFQGPGGQQQKPQNSSSAFHGHDSSAEAIGSKLGTLNGFLNDTCKSIDCYTECIRPDVTRKCGADAIALVDKFDAVAVSWALDMFRAIDSSTDFPPKACKKFAKSTTSITHHGTVLESIEKFGQKIKNSTEALFEKIGNAVKNETREIVAKVSGSLG